MVAGGAEKTDNVDKAAFKEAAQSVYDKFLSNNEQVQNTMRQSQH